jgi:hypothetical protein
LPQPFNFTCQLGNYWGFRGEQDGSIEIQDRQAIAIIEAILRAKFGRKSQRASLPNLHYRRSHSCEFLRITEFLQPADTFE